MNWQIASFAVLAVALAAGFAWYERSRPPAKVLALVAALAALAVVGRIAFAPFPNVKPTTDIVLIAGFALGGAPGFAVGAVTALVSNFFFLQGPWTPWQMAAWGGVGIAGAAFARVMRGRAPGRLVLALACALAAAGFGLVMDVYQWTLAAEQTLASYVAVSATSLAYNVAHVVSSFAFCLVIGPPLVRALRRYRERFEVRWEPLRAPIGSGAALAVMAALAVLAVPVPAAAAPGSSSAARFLERSQNGDGGFGDGASSNQLFTGWAALGLAAGGHNPQDVKRGRRSAIDYVREHAGSLKETGDLSRTILLLDASGVPPRSFGGRDLVERLRAKRGRSGSFDGLINQTAFGILALRATGAGGLAKSARWIERKQNSDGGFGFDPSVGSDVDVTGAALQGLVAGGLRGSDAVTRAVEYLRRAQAGDGGFGQRKGSPSNSQSTAFAVQGLVAAGRNPEGFRKSGDTPLGYLRARQSASGSIAYSQSSRQDPVWVTGQALLALEREAFPLATAPRRRGGGGSADGSGGGSGAGGAGGGPAAAGSGRDGGGERAGLARAGGRGGAPGRTDGERADGGEEDAGSVLGLEDGPATALPPDLAGAPAREDSGSVAGGVVAAAASAGFVFGVRRRLRKRLAAEPAAVSSES